MSTWEKYPGNRLVKKHPEGFYVIRPENSVAATPLFCPLCEFIMNSHYDDDAHKNFQCCDNCANEWAYKNANKWVSGWRPTSEQVNDAVKARAKIT